METFAAALRSISNDSTLVKGIKEIVKVEVQKALAQERENMFAVLSVRDDDSLAQGIAAKLNKPLVAMDRIRFGDGEKKVVIKENLCGKQVYVISTIGPGEDPDISFAQTCQVITTLHTTCKVQRINLLAPCLWYQAQDKAHARREPITVRNVADDLIRRGMNHIMVSSLHSEQIEIAFESFDHLKMEPMFGEFLSRQLRQEHASNRIVLLAPDEGGVRQRDDLYMNMDPELDLAVASCHQLRDRSGVDRKVVQELVGDVNGATVIILDDMMRSGSTMFNAAQAAKDKGAKQVIGVVTHFFGFSKSGKIFGQNLVDSPLDRLVVTNTRGEALARVQDGTLLCQKMQVLDVSPYFAKAIRSYHQGETIKEMIVGMDRSTLYNVAHDI